MEMVREQFLKRVLLKTSNQRALESCHFFSFPPTDESLGQFCCSEDTRLLLVLKPVTTTPLLWVLCRRLGTHRHRRDLL